MSDSNIVWRPLTAADAAALARLHIAWEEELDLPFRSTEEELTHELADPDLDLARDTRVAVTPDGSFVASAWISYTLRQGPKHRAFVMTTALADHAGLELDAIKWAEDQTRVRFAELDDDLPRVVRSFAEAAAVDQIRRYESLGFVVARHFVDMERSLAVPVAPPTLPAGVELVAWDDRWKRSAYEAQVASFVDHWGSLPPSWDRWLHGLEWPGVRLDLSHLAVADGEVVALASNGVYPQDWKLRNRSEGWIETLGTRREWRKRGLASALITASFQSFAAEGLDYACIGVDSANPTGAFHLYEALGFSEYHRSVSVMKEISPPV